MPMQPIVAPPRDGLTAAQVKQLLQDEEAVTLTGGLEIVDLDLNVVADISDDLSGGHVERNSYADLHGTANFSISRVIDWGGDLLRPYLTMTAGGVTARFNLGVYLPSTPEWPLDADPPTFEVDGYDLLLRLAQTVGDAYAIAAGERYLDKVEQILLQRGFTQYVIDWTNGSSTAPSSRVWAFDDQTTWLTIVNDLLQSIGYAGIWSDWDGRLRCAPYIRPTDRAAEWTYTDDQASTMLSNKRSVQHDYFSAPNRWVVYRTNMVEGATPVEGDGMAIITNDTVGETSIQARRGLVITKTVGSDFADQRALNIIARLTADADMQIPTLYNLETFPNPLHWHFDRVQLSDSASMPFADAMCTQWSLPLPPDSGDMQQQWRILSQS